VTLQGAETDIRIESWKQHIRALHEASKAPEILVS